MTHVFEGEPDTRQGGTAVVTSRFRPRYRALTAEDKALHDAIKDSAAHMEMLFTRVKSGRYASLAMTSLEESVMWIIKELTA